MEISLLQNTNMAVVLLYIRRIQLPQDIIQKSHNNL